MDERVATAPECAATQMNCLEAFGAWIVKEGFDKQDSTKPSIEAAFRAGWHARAADSAGASPDE